MSSLNAVVGGQLLAGSRSPVVQVGEVVARTHHEHRDGSGYPDGLAGEQIPLAGRICAICDVFDALVSARPYKPAWTVADALDEIRALSARSSIRGSWSASSCWPPRSRYRRNWYIEHTSRSVACQEGGEPGIGETYRKGPRFQGPFP